MRSNITSFLSKEILVTPFCSGFSWNTFLRPPLLYLFSQQQFVSIVSFNSSIRKNVPTDLTNRKETGTPPALGINREGLFFFVYAFWVPMPFCGSKEPCLPMFMCLNFQHWWSEPFPNIIRMQCLEIGLLVEWIDESVTFPYLAVAYLRQSLLLWKCFFFLVLFNIRALKITKEKDICNQRLFAS